jgi:hypothetical protein
MNIASVLGFPLVNYNGVITSMGLPNSVDNYLSAPYVIDLSGEDMAYPLLAFLMSSIDFWPGCLIPPSPEYFLAELRPQFSLGFPGLHVW